MAGYTCDLNSTIHVSGPMASRKSIHPSCSTVLIMTEFFSALCWRKLVAAGVVDARPVGDYPNLRQLAFLHVSHDWRGKKLALRLYQLCKDTVVGSGPKGSIFLPRQRGEP